MGLNLNDAPLALHSAIPEQIDERSLPAGVELQQHPIFWFDDGSLILRVHNQLFKVHRTLLSRHSRLLSALTARSAEAGIIAISVSGGSHDSDVDHDGLRYSFVDSGKQILVEDVEALLEHIYHDVPLDADAPFSRVASVLRVSSPQQLDFPSLHKLARQLVERMFPSGPVPFFHPDCLEEALVLATEYQITSIQKGIFYSLVTTSNFDTEGGSSSDNPVQPFGASLPPAPFDHENERNPEQDDKLPKSTSNTTSQPKPHQHRHVLSAANSRRCTQLMTQLINHFTPLLFTPAATPHMDCTDVFADTWMRLVIQPALEDDGVYKPLETLERMRGVDWAKEGLCGSCVREKMEEWRGEQEEVWRLMDKWLELEKAA